MWKKKLKLGTVLYLLARYPALSIIVLFVVLQFLNVSLQVRFVSIPKSLKSHYVNIVSPNIILQVQILCHVRVCNSLYHFTDAIFLLAVIGMQGTND